MLIFGMYLCPLLIPLQHPFLILMFYDWVYLHCNRGKNSVKAQISVRLVGRQGKKSKKRRIPMAGEQEWRTKCSTSAMSRIIITRKQENVIGQTEARICTRRIKAHRPQPQLNCKKARNSNYYYTVQIELLGDSRFR